MKRIIFTLALLPFLALPTHSGIPINGSQTCPSSGNKRLSTTSTKTIQLTIAAPFTNTGNITIGGSGVTTTNAILLLPGGSFNFAPQGNASSHDLSQTFFACTVSADSVVWTGAQ